jgi:uroporphyrinogen-III synthase
MLGMTLLPTILISRPKPDGEALAAQLACVNANMKCILAPALEIRHLEQPAPERNYDILVLTSRHAVAAAAKLHPHARAVCVGDATAHYANELGLNAVSVGANAQALIGHIQTLNIHSALHICGEHQRGDIVEQLLASRIQAERHIVYAQRALSFSQPVKAEVHQTPHLLIPLYSPRSAQVISQNLQEYVGKIDLIAISQNCAEAWSGPTPHQVTLASAPNAQAMFAAISPQMHRTP